MYRIRFHGRGGHGMVTSSRILGTAFFLEGFEVQDAPRYGAERRGAPVYAYVRASKNEIKERGVIHNPGLIVIADDTLPGITPETVFEGIDDNSVILIIADKAVSDFEKYIPSGAEIITLSPGEKLSDFRRHLSIICASAAAALTGTIRIETLCRSIEDELNLKDSLKLLQNKDIAMLFFSEMNKFASIVKDSEKHRTEKLSEPGWIDFPFHRADISTPVIRKSATSILNPTGTWRTSCPVIDRTLCSRCMLCYIYCPDSVIRTDENGYPDINYRHCKGCLICMEVCPVHAIKRDET